MPLTNIDEYYKDAPVLHDIPFKEWVECKDFFVVSWQEYDERYMEAMCFMNSLQQESFALVLEDFEEEEPGLGKAVENFIKKFAKDPTYPHVFYKGQYVGSGDLIHEMYANGELEKVAGLEPHPIRSDPEVEKPKKKK